MMSDRRTTAAPIPALALALAFGGALGCASLNYDAPPAPAASAAASPTASADALDVPAESPAATPTSTGAASDADASASSTSWDAPPPRTARRESPTRARMEQRKLATADAETPRSWRELTRDARERALDGKLDQASELLAQAALQLKDRPPPNTQRRTVFGLRARLAHDMANLGQTEAADALADTLFDEVRAEPALADAALVTLAQATAERRAAAAKAAGREASQIPLLALALDASQADTASRERLGLAFQVSNEALREGDLALARQAIDQAIVDAQIIAPGERGQAAALKVYKARIALAQRDFQTAESSALAAVETFKQVGTDASSLGVAEATLAQVVAEKGDPTRGLELARAAYTRLAGAETIVPHARRQIAASLARVELLAGEREQASAHYREALGVPADGSDRDADLIRTVKDALAELETPAAAPAPASP